ncbi:hypothetical protein PF004_g9978 [Phytophthora fragariae]|uniref:WW domain-containing protein n=1 Tax=Phytophthora fragariae TaxID=53985 RepID=A0A6A3KR08_9STRA|nr:hypothetical protein PF011_g11827 [Phytophthora fragariae]KAE9232252.1 hypothetical protein PF004_g9978 [Phytophthora fragariae]KAE9342233.1 hypothetical protein PF008_g10251 [Phytophthora fragariae]
MDEAIVEAGWEVRQDEAIGQVYYWNSITGETSWEPPPHLAAAVEEFPSTSDMTPPWTQGYDDSGRLYYLNTETMETRWTPPDEHQEEGEITSNTDVLAMTGGRGRRPSTAEQMDELNRLLSGEGEDEDEEEDPPEGEDTVIDLGAASELPPQVLNETPQEDGEACPWLMFVNEDDGVPYYYNSVTGECLWDPPEEFLRYHQEQEQEQPQFVEIGDATGSNIEDIQAQQETGGSTSKAGSRASSARPGSGMMQAEITPEFEEKVRQAIAAASSTPVGSSRLVLVRTPKQFAPRTGRSAGDDASARSIPNSGRPRSGASRPSSGGAVSRPRTPGGGPASSRIDPIPVPEGPSATPQEKVSPRFAEDDPQNELVGASEEEVPLASEDDEQDQRRIEDLAMESDTELGNYEQPTIRAVVIEEAEENTGKYVSGPLLTEDAFNEADGQIDAVERAVSLGNEAESHLIESTVDTPFGDESDSQLEPDTAEVTLDSEDEAPAAEFQLLSDMVEEISSDTGIAVDIIPSERIDEYPQQVGFPVGIELAALTLQCMVRCFIARQRVKRRRETQHHVAPPDTLELLPETGMTAVAVDPMPAKVLPTFTTAEEMELPQDADPSPPPESKETPRDADGPPTVITDQESPLPALPTHIHELGVSTDPQSSAPSARSSRKTTASPPAQEQRPRRDPASISTRLPSVLDVSTYFPSRRSHPSSRTSACSSADPTEPVAITRKTVELESPPRPRRSSRQEAEKMQAELEARRREDERVQRAQIVEYQRIWTESRRAFGAEKQRLLAEKLERDNQRDHEIAEEKRARIQAQRERDAKRSRNNLPDNEADPDRLVWQHVKAQGRPTEQNVSQFRDALAQALDSAQFPNNMCAERARELHERIGRLRRASWALDSQLESVELRLLSELHPLTNLQRPLQAKHAANLRRRLENKLNLVQSWQRVLDEWETSKENGSTSRYWDTIKSRYAPSSATFTDDKTRRHYVLNAWRGAVGGDSLLHVAAWNGWEEHVRLLIEEGADVNLIDCSASLRTPLHEACRAGHSRVVELLLRSGARLSAVDVSGDSPLHAACRGGWTRVVRILLMAANDLGDDTEQESLTLEDFFNLCNGKGRRAIEVATLPSLVEELENYDYQLNGAQQHNGGKHKQVKR